jgi:lipoyl(octanoyl) transferase
MHIQQLGRQPYEKVWEEMQAFTLNRQVDTEDQLWIVEHEPVFTLGLNGQSVHVLKDTGIPVVKTDRGGQVTYHGPGQLVIYVLLDLRRLGLAVRQLVTVLEQSMIETLAQYGLTAQSRPEAPGVYLSNGAKIGSIGLRVKKGCCYHGLSLNNDLDLKPFSCINPCGYPGLNVTRLQDQGVRIKTHELAVPVVYHLAKKLGL